MAAEDASFVSKSFVSKEFVEVQISKYKSRSTNLEVQKLKCKCEQEN